MVAIHSLKPNVTQVEAIETFGAHGILGVLRCLHTGRLRSVAEVYVPFRLYRVQIWNASQRQLRWFALDAVSGALDLYEFERAPDCSALVQVETRNRLKPILEEDRARQLLADKLQRLIFQRGFFRIRDLQIHPELIPLEIHVPFWVGFYGPEKSVRLRVLDAVRRRVEGSKARALFESWLVS